MARNGLDAVVEENGDILKIVPKKKGISDIINDYKTGVKLVFSNFSAVLVIIGFFCKQTNGTVQQLYLNYYFKESFTTEEF